MLSSQGVELESCEELYRDEQLCASMEHYCAK
ncbi:Protein of unknown function [Bacillus mycoides]|nr:Protein of unknown function [Bacillus mycoides]